MTRVRVPGGRAWLWLGFSLVHGLLIWLCFASAGWPLGDVEVVYRGWAEGTEAGRVVGITTEFVYPVLALLPIRAALFGGPDLYAHTWLGLVTLLNTAAFAVLVGRRPTPRAVNAAWWWLGFLLLLGPIALARIDAITVPLVIVALLWLGARPLWGTALLVTATWLKVWPAVVIAALLVVSKDRRQVLVVAAGMSAAIVGVALLLGSGANVFSFITAQTSRGIQIESPVGTLWMWQAALAVPGSHVYYDHDILTFQVAGGGIDVAIAVMTPLLVLVVAAVLLLGWLAQRGGAEYARLFPPLVLALVAALIAFNKVGSPQFIGWLAAPVILGLVLRGRAWRTPAVLVALIGALTQLIYPHLYDWVIVAYPPMVLVLTLRNLLVFVVFGWAVRELWMLRARRGDTGEDIPDDLSRPATRGGPGNPNQKE